jgi:hypothetical protein
VLAAQARYLSQFNVLQSSTAESLAVKALDVNASEVSGSIPLPGRPVE